MFLIFRDGSFRTRGNRLIVRNEHPIIFWMNFVGLVLFGVVSVALLGVRAATRYGSSNSSVTKPFSRPLSRKPAFAETIVIEYAAQSATGNFFPADSALGETKSNLMFLQSSGNGRRLKANALARHLVPAHILYLMAPLTNAYSSSCPNPRLSIICTKYTLLRSPS